MKTLRALGFYTLLALVCGLMTRIDIVRRWLKSQSNDTAVGFVIGGFFIAMAGPVLKAVQLAGMGALA